MELADRVLEGMEVTNEEALSILGCPDDDLLLLMNAKSGLCPEIAATALNLLFLQHRLIHIEW